MVSLLQIKRKLTLFNAPLIPTLSFQMFYFKLFKFFAMGGRMTLFLLHTSGHISDETSNSSHYETRTTLCFFVLTVSCFCDSVVFCSHILEI